MVQPESAEDKAFLIEFVKRFGLESPLESAARVSSGSCQSGCESLPGIIVANHQVRPPGFSRQSGNKKPVVVINEAR